MLSEAFRPQERATRRATDSDRCMSRLSQTISIWCRGRRCSVCEVLLGPVVADDPSDLAGSNVKGGDQGLSAITTVLDPPPLDLARLHRPSRCDPLHGLNAGLLVDGNRAVAFIGRRGVFVDGADVRAFGLEG